MEQYPITPENMSDYQRFAVEIFDDIDTLVTQRQVPSLYKKIADRYCKIELTPEEIELIGPMLETYAIDAPEAASIIIQGHNPYDSDHAVNGTFEITTQHKNLEGSNVTSRYGVWLDTRYDQAIEAFKDVHTAREMYFNNARISTDEQRALRAMVSLLKNL